MSRSQRGFPVRVALLSIIATAATIAAYLGVTGGMAGLSLDSARSHASRVLADYQEDDLAGLVEQIGELRVDLMDAQHWVSAPVWEAMAKIPGVGRSIGSLRRLVNTGGDLAQAAAEFEGVARELVAGGDTAVGNLIPDRVLTSLGPALRQITFAARHARDEIVGVDPTSLPAPFDGRLRDFAAQINSLLPQLLALAEPADALVALLGRNSPKRWLIAMQNGGESRGTGGLVGSFAAMTVQRGVPVIEQVGSNSDLVAHADPSLLPKQSQDLWGPSRLAEVYGVNLSPHYPYAGQLLASLWRHRTGQAPDAVIAIDQRATADLVGAVGGIGIDGVQVDAGNAYQLLTVGVYERFHDANAKDAFVTKLVRTLFNRLTSGTTSVAKLLPVLAKAASRQSLLIWAADPDSETRLANSPMGGVVPDLDGPFAMAVINNNAGNKLDTFLHTTVTYEQGQCVAGGRRSRVAIDLSNDAPANLPPYVDNRADRRELWGLSNAGDGSNRVRLAVYLPKAAFLARATPAQLFTGEERGHPVAMFGVELQRGERKKIEVEFTQFGGAELLNSAPQVVAQPMLNAQTIRTANGPRC